MATNPALARRSFLFGLGSAAAAAGAVGLPLRAVAEADVPPARPRSARAQAAWLDQIREGLAAPPQISAQRGSEEFWREVRQAYLLGDDYIHLNTGTTGSQPSFSLRNLAVYNLYKSRDPRDWEANLNSEFPELFPLGVGSTGNPSAIAARQAAVAALYGANPDEIVLSYNTTDALNLVFAGTPWHAGDRIITTHWEHPALRGPSAWARDQFGVELRVVGLPSQFTADITTDDVLGLFEAELQRSLPAGAKQYIAVSEISYKNGLRLPVEELSKLARSYGAYTIIDSAHGWGQIAIDAHAYGADFIAGAGHKWLGGGPGTGIFYIRNSGDDLPPFQLGNFYQYAAIDARSRGYQPNFYVQPRGELNTPALYALSDTAAFFGQVGLSDIQARGTELASHLRKRVAKQWGEEALWVQDHKDPAFRTALVSFNPFADREDSAQYEALNTASTEVVTALAAESPKIYVRTVTWRDQPNDEADNRVGFRVSTHGVYNSKAEIDHAFERLVAAVEQTAIPQLG